MSIIVISDLHLNPEYPEGIADLSYLREKYAQNCSALYILGDFFEIWVGDDEQNPFVDAVVAELGAWKALGIQLYFMAGNRDFLLGQAFAKRVGWQILEDPFVADFYGFKVLLSHGDLLCTLDQAYQKWREYVHKPWIQWLFVRLPLWVRLKMGVKARQKSRDYVQVALPQKMDVVTESAVDWMRQKHTSILIHGHTHQPGFHVYYQGKRAWTRITLSDWHHGPHALIWEKEKYRLMSLHCHPCESTSLSSLRKQGSSV